LTMTSSFYYTHTRILQSCIFSIIFQAIIIQLICSTRADFKIAQKAGNAIFRMVSPRKDFQIQRGGCGTWFYKIRKYRMMIVSVSLLENVPFHFEFILI
jgi:hypothetical protein